jgi:hypothetical protein
MKTITMIMAVLTGLSLFSTMVCGLWMRYSGEEIVESSLNFHLGVAVLTALLTVMTVVMALVQVYRLSAV